MKLLAQVTTALCWQVHLDATLVRGVVGDRSAREIGLVIAYVVLMLGACLLSCIVPTRRALGVEPTEALKTEG
ncbi:MAG: hypothetical protein ACRERX_08870 [Pseudomonas sp.]